MVNKQRRDFTCYYEGEKEIGFYLMIMKDDPRGLIDALNSARSRRLRSDIQEDDLGSGVERIGTIIYEGDKVVRVEWEDGDTDE